MAPVLGFIGVGAIAAAMVRGLRTRRPELEILLSPRSEVITSRLASEDAHVRRAGSNAGVARRAEIVVLAVRPPQMRAALEGLTFRKGQTVVSCLANVSLDDVAALVAPASVCRMIPLPMIEHGVGPLVLYPELQVVRDLFEGQGELISPTAEVEFRAYSAVSATMSTFFAFQSTLIRWLQGQGASAAAAETYVRAMHRALADRGMIDLGGSNDLVTEHETPGGINERVRMTLEREGWFETISRALDSLDRINGADLAPHCRTLAPP